MSGEQERGLLAEVAHAMEQMTAFGSAVGKGDWLVLEGYAGHTTK